MNAQDATQLARRFIQLPAHKQSLFLEALAAQGIDFGVLPIAADTAVPEAACLSYAQQRMWFLWRLDPLSAAYHLPMRVRLRGPLQPAALQQAFDGLLARHETLRCVFAEDEHGQLLSKACPLAALPLVQHDLEGLPGEQARRRLDELTEQRVALPFDLAEGPLLRADLFRMADQDHVLLCVAHHIVADGWSLNVLVEELLEGYQAACEQRPPARAPLPIQYRDYAIWQRSWLQAGGEAPQLAYWRAQLGEGYTPLALPYDHPPMAGVGAGEGASVTLELPPALALRLHTVAAGHQTTLFVLLLAAFKVLLQRYCGARHVRVGVPVANRNRVETEAVIGCFINTQLLQTELDEAMDGHALIERVKATALGAQAHQDVPYDRLVEALQLGGVQGRQPAFQVMFNHQAEVADLGTHPSVAGLRFEPLALAKPSVRCDLALDTYTRGTVVSARFSYARAVFEAATVERMGAHWLDLLQALASPARTAIGEWALSGLPPEPTLAPVWGESVQQHLLRAAERDPDRVAVSSGGQQLNYGALVRHAGTLAQALLDDGCGAEEVVAVVADRSVEMAIGIVAVLLAGAAYVPLDPEQPAERLRFCLRDAGVRRIVCAGPAPAWAEGTRCLGIDLAAQPSRFVPRHVAPAQLAYVIYTSGTTGRPKGVAISHGALSNYLAGVSARLPLATIEQLAMASTPAADLGHTVFFSALYHGLTVHLFDKRTALDAQLFAEQVAAVDLLKIVPSHLQALLDAGEGHVLPRRCLVLGGEAVTPGLLAQVARLAPGLEVINHYGPSETTVGVLTTPLHPGQASPALGVALPHTAVRVLGPSLAPVPGRAPGELHIAGAGLARGYLGQPALTAERFVPDPFGAPGTRLYRSGDRVRRDAHGLPVFGGRTDGQVKLRGYRIELAEVAHALGQYPGVTQAVARVHGQGQAAQLVGYVTSRVELAQAEVLQALRARLPEPMLPTCIVRLASLPLTANGKIDFTALPAPGQPAPSRAFVPAAEPLQQQLAQVWAQVLGVAQVGLADNFFALGGHSLLATQVVSRVRRALGLSVPLRALFDTPDLAAFAAEVAQLQPSAQGEIPRLPRVAPLPVSHAQHRQWLFWKLHPASTAYHTPLAVRLSGPLDAAAVEAALKGLIQRHETLRTVFVEVDGVPLQQVLPQATLALAREDAQGLNETQLAARLQAAVREPFDLARGPLLRALLLAQGEGSHVLLLTLHHIVSDGWSMGVLVRECLQGYQAATHGAPAGVAVPSVQYADYAVWQRERLAGGLAAEQLAYWKATLQDDFAPLSLPADRARPALQSHRGGRVDVRLPAALAERLRALAVSHNVTLFHLLLAAFAMLLGRYAGRDAVNIGVPMTNRDRVELEALIGFFVNTVVLRMALDPALPFGTYLAQVKEAALQAQAHKDIPFDTVVEALHPQRSTDHHPLFQVMYNHLRDVGTQVHAQSVEGLHLVEIDLAEESAQFDLALNTVERSDGVTASFTFASDLFDRPRVERMAGHWLNLLQAIVEAPARALGELALLGPREAHALAALTPPAPPLPAGTVHQLFEAQARAQPGALALIDGQREWTYQALNRRANVLAHALLRRGAGPGARVAVAMRRNADLVAALFAVMKAGAAYIPLDPAYPVQRLNYMLRDSGAALLLVQGDSCPALELGEAVTVMDVDTVTDGAQAEHDPARPVAAQGLAYCIYTSGSTGQPKGVMIEHRNVAALVAWSATVYRDGDLDGVLAATSICFDLSAWELFVTLGLGGYVIMADNALALAHLPARERVRLINSVPSAIGALCDTGQIPASVRIINSAGEPLRQALVERLYARTAVARVYDLYGPSEDTTYSTFSLRQPGGHDTIGRPVAGSAVYLLDAGVQPVPQGHAAEVFIAGAGLARGYLGRPALTAQRFVPDPIGAEPGQRMYRTGDLAREGADAQLQCLGRLDHQVKVRGFRVELGEVEACLRGFPGVHEAVVIDHPGPGGTELVAYLVATPAALARDPLATQAHALKAYLRLQLPAYMVPAHWVVLPELPLTPNGKVDRQRLPAPRGAADGSARRPPQTALQQQVAQVWSEALGGLLVGLDDNFFELGGHSLLATQVTARLQAQLHADVPLLELFQAATLESYVERVAGYQPGSLEALGELNDLLGELELAGATDRPGELDAYRHGPK